MDDNIYQQSPVNYQNFQQPEQQFQYPPAGPVKPKQSGLGIASFIIALVNALLVFVLIIIAGVIETQTPGGMQEDDPVTIIIGLGVLGSFFFYLIGIVLAIAGLCQANRSKVFSVLGLILNIVFLLAIVGITVLGLLVE